MILLDSSVLIELFRKKIKEKTLFYRLSETEDNFSISVITHYEIGRGHKNLNEIFWQNLYENLTIIPFDSKCSNAAIEIYLDLKSRNKLIDLADLLIGATAVVHDCPVATFNKKHFERIKGINFIH